MAVAAPAFVIGLAVVVLAWRLGSSSLFVDEVYSWLAGNASPGQLFHLVRINEVAPPTYYLMLHGWIKLFDSDSEAVMRSLSLIAAVGAVAATYWIGNLLAGRLIAVLAAALLAVSPLLLEYGQEVRSYAWAMFAVTVAVGAALQSQQSTSKRGRWLTLAATASVFAIWIHYSAALIVGVLTAYIAIDRTCPVSLRRRFVIGVGVGTALVLPFAVAQYEHGTTNAIAPYAKLTFYNLKRVIGAPFDRTYPVLSSATTVLGALVVIAGVAALWLPGAAKRVRHPRLLFCLAAGPALALLVLTIVGKSVLISRYDAIAVPFVALSIASTVAIVRWIGIVVWAAALAIAIPANLTAHDTLHEYPNTRAAVQFVASSWRRNDVLIVGTAFGGSELQYYAERYLPKNASIGYSAGFAPLFYLLTHPHYKISRLAMITQTLGSRSELAARFASRHWHLTSEREFTGTVPFQALTASRDPG
ncbi:MAG TPA: glycosyltransferase family 39 protein [Polyangiaceae bacterium]